MKVSSDEHEEPCLTFSSPKMLLPCPLTKHAPSAIDCSIRQSLLRHKGGSSGNAGLFEASDTGPADSAGTAGAEPLAPATDTASASA